MDVAITPSSPAAVPGPGPQQVSDLDAARRAQARQDEQAAQDRIQQERIEQARLAQSRQYSRNSNGEVIGTTISTTA
ncbi:hypothetical protein FHW67_000523 [Herbaspirillum sp. Sphag1AN]|jgi:hypothetical protein|uniref:hypothetical protein n=1 Tax=unclassified Herbaspirillum TaxID=2624150 RepID=UPI00161E8230|nr:MULTISPECIES: hypothetical protein [unclassified Herbaspirillum]MBB3211288.1 hypothetical protein [Herbaspirillum sp. Sphag1AN]MBB3244917.1 hypothetical protein [Herbaspirillum sp. Sphag64]